MQNHHQICKIKLRSDPPLPQLKLVLNQNEDRIQGSTEDEGRQGLMNFPFHDHDMVVVQKDDNKVMEIDLHSLIFDKQLAEVNYQFVDQHGQSYNISTYFELQQESEISLEYTLDISATNLPFKKKCFSCFPSVPLLFYEILDKNSNSLFESEISKITDSDPFWNPSNKLKKNDLFPEFTVRVYQSLDHKKSKKLALGEVKIDFDTLMNDKEFMFEMNSSDKSYIIVERVQEFNSNSTKANTPQYKS